MYKLRTKDDTYIFMCLEDVFSFIDQNEEILLESDSDYVKLYFLNKRGNKTK